MELNVGVKVLALLVFSALVKGQAETSYFKGNELISSAEKQTTGWVLPPDFKLDLRRFQKILYNISMTDVFAPETRGIYRHLQKFADSKLPIEYSTGLRELLKLFDPMVVTTDPVMGDALNYPKARLHYGEGDKRNQFDYDYTVSRATRGCFTFAHHGMYMKIKDFESIETFGTCIRLFNGPKCSQQSVAFYPSERLHWSYFIFPWFPSGSIGPCTPQEFLWTKTQEKVIGNGTITLYDKEEYKDGVAYTPNILNFLEFPDRDDDDTLHKSPVWLQTTGHAGSIHKLWAKFYKKHLKPNESLAVQPSDITKKVLGSMEVKDGDVLGYVIHPKLGGPIESSYNVIPQSKWNWREWNRICTELVFDYLSSKGDSSSVKVTLSFDYDQWNSTRPLGFSYWIEQAGSEIYYGYLSNLK